MIGQSIGVPAPGGALVTGGMSDIGRATAVALAQAGYDIALGHFHHGEAEASAFAASLVREHGAPRAVAVRADVRERADVERLAAEARAALGSLRVLVNAAGVNRDGPIIEMTDDQWADVCATILDGTFFCCRESAQHFEGDEGCIVNIGAVTALKGRKNGANYCAARAGVVALTKCLALELGPRIRVVALTPGMIATSETSPRYGLDEPERRAFWEGSIPLGKLGAPSEVAAMIRYLVTPGCYVTGQNFFVDGGYFTH